MRKGRWRNTKATGFFVLTIGLGKDRNCTAKTEKGRNHVTLNLDLESTIVRLEETQFRPAMGQRRKAVPDFQVPGAFGDARTQIEDQLEETSTNESRDKPGCEDPEKKHGP